MSRFEVSGFHVFCEECVIVFMFPATFTFP